MRLVAAIIAFSAFSLIAAAANASELPTPPAVHSESQSVYTTTGQLPGTRVESVLTDLRGAVTSAPPGTGWLLHAGPRKRDTCDEVDATSGLRMMCVGW
jgi:hypothetical protein